MPRRKRVRPRAEQRDNWTSLPTVAGHLEMLDSMPMLAEELDLEEDQVVVLASMLMLEVVLASTDVQSTVLFPPGELSQVVNKLSESRPRPPAEPDPLSTVDLCPSRPAPQSRDNNVGMFHPSPVPLSHARVVPQPPDNSADLCQNRSVKMCLNRSTDRNVQQFQNRVVELFPSRNVGLFLSSLVGLCLSRSVDLFLNRNVDKFPRKSVEMCHEKNVELCLDSLVALSHNSPAELFLNNSAAQSHGNSV